MKIIKKKTNIFPILFCIELVCFCLSSIMIAVISDSNFAFTFFKVVYFLSVASLFITAFIRDVKSSRNLQNVVHSSLVYIVGGTIFLSTLLFKGLMLFIALVYSVFMLVLLVIRIITKIKRENDEHFDTLTTYIMQTIVVFGLVVIVMFKLQTINFVSQKYLLWALIPTTFITIIISVIALYIFKDKLKKLDFSKFKNIGQMLLSVFCIFMVAMIYSTSFIATTNYVFDNKEAVRVEFEVLEKKSVTGGRGPSRYEVKVAIDDERKWMEIPMSDYRKISEGDIVQFDYHKGALNIPYYVYVGDKN